MTRTIEVLYEDGILRPLEPLDGVTEHSRLKITLEVNEPRLRPMAGFVGTLSDEDAREMERIIKEEFGRIDAEEWK